MKAGDKKLDISPVPVIIAIAVSSNLQGAATLVGDTTSILLGGYAGRVCTIDANGISKEVLGKVFPNTPMLAATVKVSGVVEPEKFKADMEESFHHKFATKPQVIAGNMKVLNISMEEVQG